MKIYKYMTADRAKQFLLDFQMRFTPPMDQNDPYEMRPHIIDSRYTDSDSDNLMRNFDLFSLGATFSGNISDRIGISCFSKTPSCSLMWSHYAQNHTGVVIEFDANHEFFNSSWKKSSVSIFRNVTYSDIRPKLDAKILLEGEFDMFSTYWPGWRIVLEKAEEIFFTKPMFWSYEEEIRFLKTLQVDMNFPSHDPIMRGERRHRRVPFAPSKVLKSQLFTVPQDAISGVIIGAKSQLLNSEELYDFGFADQCGLEAELRWRIQLQPKLKHVSVQISALDSESFSINIFDPMEKSNMRQKCLPQMIANMYDLGFEGKLGRDALMQIARSNKFRKIVKKYQRNFLLNEYIT